MTITAASLEPFDIRLTQAISTSRGSLGDRSGVRVMLTDSTGVVGLGETAPIPGLDAPSVDAIAAELTPFLDTLVGADVSEALAGLDQSGLSVIARFGVHTALADLASGSAELPLHAWLRAGSGGTIRTNALVSSDNPATVHSQVSEAIANGARSVKLKVGVLDPSADVTRIIAASEAAGPAVELRLDANGAWTDEQVRFVVGRVGQHRLSYIEDPTDDPHVFGSLERELGVRMAYDVSPDLRGDVRRIVDDFDQSVFVVKPVAVGGVDRVLDLSRALGSERTLVVTSSIDGPVALLAALHAAAALPDELTAHGLATADLVRGMPHELHPVSGAVQLAPDAVGLGATDLLDVSA